MNFLTKFNYRINLFVRITLYTIKLDGVTNMAKKNLFGLQCACRGSDITARLEWISKAQTSEPALPLVLSTSSKL